MWNKLFEIIHDKVLNGEIIIGFNEYITEFELIDWDDEGDGDYWCLIQYVEGEHKSHKTITINMAEVRNEKLKKILI